MNPTIDLCWDFAPYMPDVLSYDIGISTEKAHIQYNVSEIRMKDYLQ